MRSPRVLIVDDDRDLCLWLERVLQARGVTTVSRLDADQAFALLDEQDFDVVLTDLQMPGMDGFGLCERVVVNRPDVPVVVMTAYGSMEAAVRAIRAGAYDFLAKPVEPAALALVIERAVAHRKLRQEVRRLRQVQDARPATSALVGESPALRAVQELLSRAADSDAAVLLTGESGTGKEVVARELHARGHRRDGPFLAINCAAMSEAVLEDELFGHARSAFPEARAPLTGLFLRANGGTLYLDEVGTLPLGVQARLLRALQTRTVRPQGGEVDIPFDTRLVCSTPSPLEEAVREGSFREELSFHLNVIGLELPALRARGNDVLLLAQRFVEQFAIKAGKKVTGFSQAVAHRLLAHDWPGNVRELRNCVERAVSLTRFEELTVEDLPEKLRSYRNIQALVATGDPAELVTMEELERRYILQVLQLVGGSRVRAARTLGLDRKTLYRKLERWRRTEAEPKPRAA